VLEGLVLEIVAHELDCARILENFSGAGGLDGAARMHGDGRRTAALDSLRERIGEWALIFLTEERTEILHEPGPPRVCRVHPGAPRLGCGGKLDPVGRETVAHELSAHALRVPVLAEYRE
jgi:hypothetical protein